MNRTALAAALAATTLLAPAAATTAAHATTGTDTVVCGTPGAPNYLTIRACLAISGHQVRAYGYVSPTDPSWQDQQVTFLLTTAGVTSPPQATDNPTVLITSAATGGTNAGSVTGAVPCNTPVRASFSINQPGWAPSTATVTATVTC
ncbi:hypothetical protein [Kitasatospora sp. NPDC101183]|uniref:hypothetical protein n=1 Tax=Kitasatospora sp. NPDC101183 TaxID=3364100 RepID=UPI00382C3F9E